MINKLTKNQSNCKNYKHYKTVKNQNKNYKCKIKK